MTKKGKLSAHGGKRAGAGRKPKPIAPKVSISAQAAIDRLSIPVGPASEIAPDAYAALREVINDGTAVASARVIAARAIIDLAKAEQAAAAGDVNAPTGKKALAAQAAQTVVTTPNDEWGTDLMLPN